MGCTSSKDATSHQTGGAPEESKAPMRVDVQNEPKSSLPPEQHDANTTREEQSHSAPQEQPIQPQLQPQSQPQLESQPQLQQSGTEKSIQPELQPHSVQQPSPAPQQQPTRSQQQTAQQQLQHPTQRQGVVQHQPVQQVSPQKVVQQPVQQQPGVPPKAGGTGSGSLSIPQAAIAAATPSKAVTTTKSQPTQQHPAQAPATQNIPTPTAESSLLPEAPEQPPTVVEITIKPMEVANEEVVMAAEDGEFLEDLPPAPPAMKRGMILKCGHIVQSWKNRYFVLSEGIMTYYEAPSSNPPYGLNKKGEMNLRHTEMIGEKTKVIIRRLKTSDSSRVSHLSRSSSSRRTFSLKEDSGDGHGELILDIKYPSERDEWMEAIQSHIEYYTEELDNKGM
jgi:hypothetical protein